MDTVNYKDKTAKLLIKKSLCRYIYGKDIHSLVFLCIGSDRSTGDSLGPLVGHQLNRLPRIGKECSIYGTLDEPVHAQNLKQKTKMILNTVKDPYIVAIDASLGSLDKIGRIIVERGPLKPGAGVSKKLDPVGDVRITGVVNISGFMEFSVLQNTRLSVVMNMAAIISSAIWLAFLSMTHESSQDTLSGSRLSPLP